MMEILSHPNETLRQPSSDVSFFDDLLKAIVDQMIDAMYTNGGVGIAAPQVGISRKIIIVDPSAGEDAKQMTVMVNPKILSTMGSQESIEGCLSIPNTRGKVTRAEEVEVEYQTITGETLRLKATGFHATIIQHEVDHLFGILFIDRATEITTSKKQLRKTA
jgi:peptide deformylase